MAAVLPNVNAAEVALVLVKLTASLLAAHGRRAEGYEAPVPCPEPGCFRAWALEEVNKPGAPWPGTSRWHCAGPRFSPSSAPPQPPAGMQRRAPRRDDRGQVLTASRIAL